MTKSVFTEQPENAPVIRAALAALHDNKTVLNKLRGAVETPSPSSLNAFLAATRAFLEDPLHGRTARAELRSMLGGEAENPPASRRMGRPSTLNDVRMPPIELERMNLADPAISDIYKTACTVLIDYPRALSLFCRSRLYTDNKDWKNNTGYRSYSYARVILSKVTMQVRQALIRDGQRAFAASRVFDRRRKEKSAAPVAAKKPPPVKAFSQAAPPPVPAVAPPPPVSPPVPEPVRTLVEALFWATREEARTNDIRAVMLEEMNRWRPQANAWAMARINSKAVFTRRRREKDPAENGLPPQRDKKPEPGRQP